MSLGSIENNRRNLVIDQLAQNRYRVLNREDMDGDGVRDGESLSGQAGRVVNEGALNQILAARGLRVANGEMSSTDGFSVTSSNARAATDFTGTPALPDRAVSTTASMRGSSGTLLGSWHSAANGMNRLDTSEELENAALMWHSLSEMARTAMRDQKDAKDLKHAMQRGKIESKKNEIKAHEEQIQAEREAAAMKFAFAVAGAVATAVVGSANPALGQAIGGVINAAGEYINKTSGPQARADEKKIEQQRHQMMQEMMEQGVESAKANYEEARELFKLAMKIITEHQERQTQISNTITRT